MPRERPHLSITLPRNFTFHYSESEGPTTPENEIPAPVPKSPPRATTFRHQRRPRLNVSNILHPDLDSSIKDVPIPTIETSTANEPFRPLFQHRATEPTDRLLYPDSRPKFKTLPRTPSPQLQKTTEQWNAQSSKDLGESLSRPMSACSLLSTSSDESDGSLASNGAGGGSCTSPESDAPDPFKFASIRKSKAKQWASLVQHEQEIQSGGILRRKSEKWTPEMDQHLWSTYHIYLQDPKVTPFKMLPGVPPPLGVCHRVAREARKTWRGGKPPIKLPPVLMSPLRLDSGTGDPIGMNNNVPDSPDTIRAARSGSNTPTKPADHRHPPWPKSGSSTRRRLRDLCKRKPSIAPHYQRLLQSRSPSPFSSSSPRAPRRAHSRLSEVSSSLSPQSSPFNTRDIQLSLTTSTSATMHPNGPLSQLAGREEGQDWFNEPPVPWASPTAIPSDVSTGVELADSENVVPTPRLGSPFGHHTWGPSRSRQRIRPNASRVQSSDTMSFGPSLRSPAKLHDTFPYSGVPKRRALHALEDELSPGGSNRGQDILENLLSGGRHRRVRSRGFSLGDMATSPPTNLFTPPNTTQETLATQEVTANASSLSPYQDSTTPTQPRRLASPFAGIAPRPTRTRHVASASLGSYEPFSSIGETLSQSRDTSLLSALAQSDEHPTTKI